MSDPYWLGTATAVAQESRATPANVEIGDVFSLIVGGVTVATFTATAATVANVTAGLTTAWNASTHPYAAAVTASDQTTYVKLLADIAGVPFVVTSSTSDGGGSNTQTLAITTPTASAGPNHWDTAANWSTGIVPPNSSNVYFRNSNVPCLWGLDQSSVTPSLLVIEQTYTGTIGLPYNKLTTAAGTYNTGIPEYRTSYLKIGAAAVRIGENYSSKQASGSALIKLDLGTTNSEILVFNSGNSTDGLPPIRIKDTNASSTLKIYGASQVGVCWEDPADTGQLSEIGAFAGNGTPTVYVGGGVTLATLNAVAGNVTVKNAPTTVKVESAATLTLAGSGTITTLEKRGEVVMAGTYEIDNLKG